MAKITFLEAKTYNNKPSGFKVTLSDGRSGNLQEKESDKGLRVGDEVIVTEIPYTSKAGVTSTLLGLRLNTTGVQQSAPTPPPQQTTPNLPQNKPFQPLSPSGGGITPLEVFKAKNEANLRVMEVVLNAFFDGKVDNNGVVAKFNEWKIIMENTVDEVAREK